MSAVRKYAFSEAFESGVILALASSPRFFEAIGHALDHERMPSEAGKLVVKAAKECAQSHGGVPPSGLIVVQRVRSYVEDGRVTLEKFRTVETALALAADLGAADDVDALIAEATPIVQRVAQQEAVEATLGEFAKGLDSVAVSERFEKIASLGQRRASVTETLIGDAADIAASFEQQTGDRLSTGIAELDRILNGGLERQALGVVMGGTGGGKSLFLTHVAADALFCGVDVAYVTLELPTKTIKARIYSNLCNMTADEIVRNPQEAARRWAFLQSRGLGRLETIYETAQATTVPDIRRWMKERQREANFSPRLVIIDMGDHLVSKVGSDKRSYDEMRIVYSGIRQIAVDIDGWAWTASHVKSGNSGKKALSVDQAADSAHKARLSDLIVSLPRTDEDEQNGDVRFGIPKRRNDQAHGQAGPIPMDAIHGRMIAMSRDTPWG